MEFLSTSRIKEVGIPVIVFGPRVDSERSVPFFPDHPRELLKSGQFSRVPLIIGMDKNEGLAMLLGTAIA
jgi:Carboxylesterase family